MLWFLGFVLKKFKMEVIDLIISFDEDLDIESECDLF